MTDPDEMTETELPFDLPVDPAPKARKLSKSAQDERDRCTALAQGLFNKACRGTPATGAQVQELLEAIRTGS